VTTTDQQPRVPAEAVPAGVITARRDGTILAANQRAADMLGYAHPRELAGRGIDEFVPDRMRAVHGELREQFASQPTFRPMGHGRDLHARRADGTELPVEISLGYEQTADGPIVHTLISDITERKRHERTIVHQAAHDPLTGLPNRMTLVDRANRAIAAARRDGGEVAVMFIDLDNFKLINDSLGHPAGDELLRTVARRLADAKRPGDTVARIGGDEFAVLCEQLSSPSDAPLIADRLRDALSREPMQIADSGFVITASIGVATLQTDVGDPDTLLAHADMAMYRAKAHGRARVAVYDKRLHEQALRAFALQRDLRGAAARGELRLCYQPVIRLRDGRLESFEALVRWQRGQRTVSPGQFIELAERSGAIAEVTDWVLDAAVAQLAEWQREHPAARVAINLSARDVTAELPGRLTELADRRGADLSGLAVEVTETALLVEPGEALPVVQRLRGLGAGLLLDDFGTGYSSLAHVAAFPVDGIKIDRSFVAASEAAPNARAVVDAVVGLAGGLDCAVIAEGVETAGQRELVANAGCGYAQGYHFSRPLEAARAGQFLAAA
jgi:diguanylate cyclase (GGDEF)-like protein/PAS domain S-box-containing protein